MGLRITCGKFCSVSINFPNTFHSVGIELQLEKAKCSDGEESAPYNDINELKNRQTFSDTDSTKTTNSQPESVKPDSIKVSQHVDKTSSINENIDSQPDPPGEVLSDVKAMPSDETETNCSNSQLNDEPQPDDQKSEETVAKNKLRGESSPSQESDFEVEVPKSKPKSKSDKSTSKKDKVKVIPLDIEAEVKGMTEDPRLISPCRVDDSIDLEVVMWPEQTSTDNKPDRKEKHGKKKHSKSHKTRNVSGDEKSHRPPCHTSSCSNDNSEPVEGNTGYNVKLEPVFETLNPIDVCQGVGLPSPKLEIQVKDEIISPPASHTLTCSSPMRLEQPLTDDEDIDIKPVTDDSKSAVTIEGASHDTGLSNKVESPDLGPLTVNTDMTVVDNVISQSVTPCSEISTVSPASTADTLNSDHGAKNTSSKTRDSITSVLDICNKTVSKSFKIPKRRQSSPPVVKVKSEPMKSPPARVSSNPYEDTRRAVKADPQDLANQKQVSSGRSRGHESETESKEDRMFDNQKRSHACHGSSDAKSRHDSENSLDRRKISEKSPVHKSENRASDKRERREHKEHEKTSIVQKTDRGTHGKHSSSSRDQKYSKHPKSHERDERKPSKPVDQLDNNSRDKQRSPEKSRHRKLSLERSGEWAKRSQSSNSTHKKDDKGE